MEPDGLEPTTPALQNSNGQLFYYTYRNGNNKGNHVKHWYFPLQTTLSFSIILDFWHSLKPIFSQNNPFFCVGSGENPSIIHPDCGRHFKRKMLTEFTQSAFSSLMTQLL